MNVLSLFDGISCGMVALERAGVTVDKYYASEIDKHAITVSESNHLNIIRLGDINNWEHWDIDFSSIDLILAGSPCQGFSFAGKQLAFNDSRSALFFRFVEILEHVKSLNSNVKFLLENVRMKKEYQNVISSVVGCEPMMIDSALLSAQSRKRLYWFNWDGVKQPIDKCVFLSEIIMTEVCEKTICSAGWRVWWDKNKDFQLKKTYSKLVTCDSKAITLTARMYANWRGNFIDISNLVLSPEKTFTLLENETASGKIGYAESDSPSERVYNIHGEAVTLCGNAGRGGAKRGKYLFGCITPDRLNKSQNGGRFNAGEKFYTLTSQDRHGILKNGYIRKLHPIECERLQTLPDNYTASISTAQRYKSLGNGWTVDVIAHILKPLEDKA